MSRKITEEYDGYEIRYPHLAKHVHTQAVTQRWLAEEVKVEKEATSILYELSDVQSNALKKLLPLFLRYELVVSTFWTDVYSKLFKSVECQDLGVAVAFYERIVHAKFYDKINTVYGLNNDQFYLSYLDDPAFKERAKWLGKTLKGKDKLQTCLNFGLIEAAALFSAFALIRSFQANGYNLIPVTVKGTKQSAIDEKLHSVILADTIKTYYKELDMVVEDDKERFACLLEAARIVDANEDHIIDSVIVGDEFNGIKKSEYKNFVRCCINEYFKRLGAKTLPFAGVTSPLSEWFEVQNEAYSETDFFVDGVSKEYTSGFDETLFGSVWN